MFNLSDFEQSLPWQWASLAKEDSLPRRGESIFGHFRERNWPLRDLGSLAMFQIPAYDSVPIVMMGFGVLLAAALAFVL